MKEKTKYLKTAISVLLVSLIFTGVLSQPVHADLAGPGTIVMDFLPVIILIGIAIAVIWVISFFVIKQIKKKNDLDNK